MTRTMYDALYPEKIPLDTPTNIIIAAYLGHSANPQSYAQAVDRFPNHLVVSIAAKNPVDAQILDIEHEAMEPTNKAGIRDWVVRQDTRGQIPTLYANTSDWQLVRTYFPEGACPQWWEARWNGDPTVYPGTVGHQYANSDHAIPPGAYDTSVVVDYWPGVDMTQPSSGLSAQDIFNIWNTGAGPGAPNAVHGSYAQDAIRAAVEAVLASTTPPIAGQGTFTFETKSTP